MDFRQVDLHAQGIGLGLGGGQARLGGGGLGGGLVDHLLGNMALTLQAALAGERALGELRAGARLVNLGDGGGQLGLKIAGVEHGQALALADPVANIGIKAGHAAAGGKAERAGPARRDKAGIGFQEVEIGLHFHRHDRGRDWHWAGMGHLRPFFRAQGERGIGKAGTDEAENEQEEQALPDIRLFLAGGQLGIHQVWPFPTAV